MTRGAIHTTGDKGMIKTATGAATPGGEQEIAETAAGQLTQEGQGDGKSSRW